MKIRMACIQMNATDDLERNLHEAIVLAHEAHHKGAQFIAYPEMFLYRGSASRYPKILKQTENVIHKFQHIACMSRVPILLGSILERSLRTGRYFNTSILISDQGKIISRYRKIHLFDVKTPGKNKFRESDYFLPGKSVVTAALFGTTFGLSVCFDLRFPGHFQALRRKAAEIIFVPSNFLNETGKVHWHTLLKARAIENQVFIVAPAQVGKNPVTKHESYGHSLIIDPWGKVLAEGSAHKNEIAFADLDLDFLRKLRRDFPLK